MSIRNKDGSIFKLHGPNPAMNKQSFWDEDSQVHNFNPPEFVSNQEIPLQDIPAEEVHVSVKEIEPAIPKVELVQTIVPAVCIKAPTALLTVPLTVIVPAVLNVNWFCKLPVAPDQVPVPFISRFVVPDIKPAATFKLPPMYKTKPFVTALLLLVRVPVMVKLADKVRVPLNPKVRLLGCCVPSVNVNAEPPPTLRVLPVQTVVPDVYINAPVILVTEPLTVKVFAPVFIVN